MKKLSLLIIFGVLAVSLLPATTWARNVKKTYIHVSKEGNQATLADLGNIASTYGQIENTLAHISYDFSGKNNAVVSSGTREPGPIDNSALKNGYAQTSFKPEYNVTDEITVEVWLKIEKSNPWYAQHPVNRWGPDGTNTANFVFYHFGNYNGVYAGSEDCVAFYANAGGTWKGISPWYKLEKNKWYHIALAYHKDKGGQLYINGEPKGGRTGGGALQVNARYGEIYNSFGSIDDVRIWKKERTAQQIKDNYKKKLTYPQPDLLGNWDF